MLSSVFAEPVEKGLKAAGNGRSLKNFDVAPFVTCVMGDDVKECREALANLWNKIRNLVAPHGRRYVEVRYILNGRYIYRSLRRKKRRAEENCSEKCKGIFHRICVKIE